MQMKGIKSDQRDKKEKGIQAIVVFVSLEAVYSLIVWGINGKAVRRCQGRDTLATSRFLFDNPKIFGGNDFRLIGSVDGDVVDAEARIAVVV